MFSGFDSNRYHRPPTQSSYRASSQVKKEPTLAEELYTLLSDKTMEKSERAEKLKEILLRLKFKQDHYYEKLIPDINAPISHTGYTALTLALSNKDEDSALTLLNANANPNITHRGVCTPLAMTAVHNLKASTSHLLEKNADVNAKRECDGITALHMAADWSHYDIVTILLAHGADHTLMSDEGKTALDYAISQTKNPISIVKLLLENGAVIKNPSKMQKYLMSQNQNNKDVKYCYTTLTQHSISSTPNTSTQANSLTISDIISRILTKIEESRSNDKGFLSLFRDTVFSSNQINIANELITRLNNISQQLPSDQLKTKIRSEFETALIAFNILLANKTKGLVGTRALDPGTEKSMAGTRFHATILALMKEISSSDITPDSHIAQDNVISGDGATSFELKPLAPR